MNVSYRIYPDDSLISLCSLIYCHVLVISKFHFLSSYSRWRDELADDWDITNWNIVLDGGNFRGLMVPNQNPFLIQNFAPNLHPLLNSMRRRPISPDSRHNLFYDAALDGNCFGPQL